MTASSRRGESGFGFRRPVRCFAFVCSALLAVALAARAGASVTLVHDEEVIVQAHEVIEDDLVVFAPYVRIDGLVKGDLVVLGSEVVVEGIVEQDLQGVAKTLYLNGTVGDDLRMAVYAVALGESASVSDDAWGLGYSLEAKPGSRIGGSLNGAFRQLLLAGQVVESVLARAGAFELQGLVGGSVNAVVGGLEGFTHSSFVVDANVEIPPVPDGITVTGSAAIGGDLDHRSPEPARVSPDARIAGRVRHEQWRGAPTGGPPRFDGEGLFEESGHEGVERVVVLLLVGWLVAVAAPRFLAGRIAHIRQEPVSLLGWGLGTVIFTVLLSALVGFAFLLMLVVGISSGLGGLAVTALFAGALVQTALGALFLLSAFYLGPALAAAGLGGAVAERVRPGAVSLFDDVRSGLVAVSVGVVLYGLLRVVPWAGVPIGVAAALVGLGALAAGLRKRLDE